MTQIERQRRWDGVDAGSQKKMPVDLDASRAMGALVVLVGAANGDPSDMAQRGFWGGSPTTLSKLTLII